MTSVNHCPPVDGAYPTSRDSVHIQMSTCTLK